MGVSSSESGGDAAPEGPTDLIRRLVDALFVTVPEADGAAVELLDGDVLTAVCVSGRLADQAGAQVQVRGSLSGLALTRRTPVRCTDVAADERVEQEVCLRSGIASLVCVPIFRDAEAVGVLTLTSTARDAFRDTEDSVLSYLARLLGAAVGGWPDARQTSADLLADASSRPGGLSGPQLTAFITRLLTAVAPARDGAFAGRIEQLITRSAITMLFQPIIDLKTGRLAGAEALARFPDDAGHGTEEWFTAAQRQGRGLPLQLLTVTAALHHLPALPPRAYLAVNVDHHAASSPELRHLLTMVDPSRIVIELTEQQRVPDYDALAAATTRLRQTGARLAIDDTGAGFAGFSHILKLAPDLIKLDRTLTTGIDSDPARQALGEALAGFAAATGASVIAEGVETPEELDAIRQLGIGYGQGYLLGRPVPAADVAATAAWAAAQLTRPLSRRLLP